MPGAPHRSWEPQSLTISSSKWCPQQLECSAVLDFRKVQSPLSPKGDTQHPALSSLPLWRRPGPMEVPVSHSLPFGKGSPLPCLHKQTKTIRQLILIVTSSTRSLSFLERLLPLSCVWASWVLEESSLPQQLNCICIQCKWMLHTLPFIEQYHQSLRLEI